VRKKQAFAQEQADSKTILRQTQNEFRDFRREVSDARKDAEKPGSPTERLDATIDRLNKALGKPRSAPSVSAGYPALQFLRNIQTPGGGRPIRLDVLMKAAGYSGSTDMAVLTVYNADDSSDSFILSTDGTCSPTTSHPIEPGSYDNLQGGEDTSRVFICSAKPVKLHVDFRPR